MAKLDLKEVWPGWETVRPIGRGSFGTVYEIQRDVYGHREKAAVKHIPLPPSDSDISELYDSGYDEASVTATYQAQLEKIVNEYSLMREMNGAANVVNCDDFRTERQENGVGWDIFIKMELLTPLPKCLAKEADEEQVIRIGKDMCRALMLCGLHNIIHRDIKPQNIFYSKNGDYKLGDFGIAKTVEKTGGGTKTGTYNYMAPEVYNNRPYNSTVDIYSLGLVLYWILNERRLPFMPPPSVPAIATQEEEARLRRVKGEPIPAPIHGSKALQRVVLKACAYDPGDRFRSAEEMLRDLDNLEFRMRNEPNSEWRKGTTASPAGPDASIGATVSAGPPSKPGGPQPALDADETASLIREMARTLVNTDDTVSVASGAGPAKAKPETLSKTAPSTDGPGGAEVLGPLKKTASAANQASAPERPGNRESVRREERPIPCPRCGAALPRGSCSCLNCGALVSPSGPPGKETKADGRKRGLIPVCILAGVLLLGVFVLVLKTLLPWVLPRPQNLPDEESRPVVAVQEPTDDPQTIIVQPPTPSPTPVPIPESVEVFFFEDEKEEFTEKVGEAVKLKAVAYPVDQFPNAKFKWSVNDESVVKLTVSEDTRECEVLCLKHQPGGVTLTVECNGVTKDVKVYTKN